MRDLPVTHVQFYPVQYNPVIGELRLYRRILARITWDTPKPAAAKSIGRSAAYENMLKDHILNYGSLDRSSVTKEDFLSKQTRSKDAPGIGTEENLKVSVTESGIYKLTYNDLSDAGLDLSGVDPRTIKMHNKGAETPFMCTGRTMVCLIRAITSFFMAP